MKKYTITKPHTNIIEISQNDSENWFYDVTHKTKRTGVLISNSMITVKDVDVWLEQYRRNGYIITEVG